MFLTGEEAGRDLEGRWSLGEVGVACLGGIVAIDNLEEELLLSGELC